MKRIAKAHWNGLAKEGSGTLTAPGGVLNNTPYSFASRFENKNGTNPEELIAAAHAGCFTMALSFALGNAGFTPTSLDTEAVLTLDSVPAGFAITSIHLETRASIPGIDNAKFQTVAADAKATCPVSKVLNTKVTLNATLSA